MRSANVFDFGRAPDCLQQLLMSEAQHQEIPVNKVLDFVLAALDELWDMPAKDAAEWANERIKMHNEWVDSDARSD